MKGPKVDENSSREFVEPYLQVTCVDPATSDPATLDEFNRYYTEVHAPDVVRNNPGIRRSYRYELDIRDPRGALGPKWLSVYEWENRHGAQVFVVRGEAPGGSWRPDYLPEPPIWSGIGRGKAQWGRLMCNKLSDSGPPLPAPAAILMEGFDLPEGSEGALQAFFTSEDSLKIDERTSYSRVSTYLLEDLSTKQAPIVKQPKYLRIYEADAETAETFAGAVRAPAVAVGPDAWQARDIAWQIVYRRISEVIYPGARYTAKML
jgi:hypothetical protein